MSSGRLPCTRRSRIHRKVVAAPRQLKASKDNGERQSEDRNRNVPELEKEETLVMVNTKAQDTQKGHVDENVTKQLTKMPAVCNLTWYRPPEVYDTIASGDADCSDNTHCSDGTNHIDNARHTGNAQYTANSYSPCNTNCHGKACTSGNAHIPVGKAYINGNNHPSRNLHQLPSPKYANSLDIKKLNICRVSQSHIPNRNLDCIRLSIPRKDAQDSDTVVDIIGEPDAQHTAVKLILERCYDLDLDSKFQRRKVENLINEGLARESRQPQTTLQECQEEKHTQEESLKDRPLQEHGKQWHEQESEILRLVQEDGMERPVPEVKEDLPTRVTVSSKLKRWTPDMWLPSVEAAIKAENEELMSAIIEFEKKIKNSFQNMQAPSPKRPALVEEVMPPAPPMTLKAVHSPTPAPTPPLQSAISASHSPHLSSSPSPRRRLSPTILGRKKFRARDMVARRPEKQWPGSPGMLPLAEEDNDENPLPHNMRPKRVVEKHVKTGPNKEEDDDMDELIRRLVHLRPEKTSTTFEERQVKVTFNHIDTQKWVQKAVIQGATFQERREKILVLARSSLSRQPPIDWDELLKDDELISCLLVKANKFFEPSLLIHGVGPSLMGRPSEQEQLRKSACKMLERPSKESYYEVLSWRDLDNGTR